MVRLSTDELLVRAMAKAIRGAPLDLDINLLREATYNIQLLASGKSLPKPDGKDGAPPTIAQQMAALREVNRFMDTALEYIAKREQYGSFETEGEGVRVVREGASWEQAIVSAIEDAGKRRAVRDMLKHYDDTDGVTVDVETPEKAD